MNTYANNNWIPYDTQNLFVSDFTPEQTRDFMSAGGSFGIILLIVATLFIGCLIIVVVTYNSINTGITNGQDNTPPPPAPPAISIFQGSGNNMSGWLYNGYDRTSQTTCESDERGTWKDGACSAISPFWGTNLQNEGYSNQYISIGTPVIGSGEGINTHLDIIDTFVTDRLSFRYDNANPDQEQSLCTNLCENVEGCVGVVWTQGENISPGTCTLFSGATTDSLIPFNNVTNNGPNMYIKLDKIIDSIKFPNTVILFNTTSLSATRNMKFGRPYRYWINLENQNMIMVNKGEINIIGSGLVPVGAINQSNLTGYYSLSPFTPDDVQFFNDNFYIHLPGEKLRILASWYGPKIYVMYI